MATEKGIDATLDATALKLLTWKPSIMRNIAITIAARAVYEEDRVFWADDIDFGFIDKKDRNCIGMAWRMLISAGILKRTNLNRRSTKDASKGRVVFKYRLASKTRAETFLRRNGWTGKVTARGESLLFPVEELVGMDEAELRNIESLKHPPSPKSGPTLADIPGPSQG